MTPPPTEEEKEFDRLKLLLSLEKWHVVLLARELSKHLTIYELRKIINQTTKLDNGKESKKD